MIFQVKINFIKYLSERMGIDVTPQQRIEDMMQVAHMCIDLFIETEEYYGEVSEFF